jgi:hypothetical protein
MSSFGCELEYFERIRRCTWTWQRGYRRWGDLGLTGGDEFHSGGLQIGGAPVRNFAVLAAARAEKQKGRGRGRPGLFIGRVLMAITAINYRGSNSGRFQEREGVIAGEGKSDRRVPGVSERKRERGIPVRL